MPRSSLRFSPRPWHRPRSRASPSTSAGNVAQGGTSAGTATFLFTERRGCGPRDRSAGTDRRSRIAAGRPRRRHRDFGRHARRLRPGSLGASATIIAGSVLTVTRRPATDTANVETITITGLKIKASADATRAPSWRPSAAPAGRLGAFQARHRHGDAASSPRRYGIGTTTVAVARDDDRLRSPLRRRHRQRTPPSAASVPTGITDSHRRRAGGPGQQTISRAPPSTASHLANDVVTQTVRRPLQRRPACSPSPARSSAAAHVRTPAPRSTVFPGENNSAARRTSRSPSRRAGFLAKGLDASPTRSPRLASSSRRRPPSATRRRRAPSTPWSISAPVLSADRKSVDRHRGRPPPARAPATITLSNILYDVAATVPGGTFVDVNVTLSGGLSSCRHPRTNAVVFRGITATRSDADRLHRREQPGHRPRHASPSRPPASSRRHRLQQHVLQVCPSGVELRASPSPRGPRSRPATSAPPRGRRRLARTTSSRAPRLRRLLLLLDRLDRQHGRVDDRRSATTTSTTGPLINVNVQPGARHRRDAPSTSAPATSSTAACIATVELRDAAFRNQVAVTALSQPTIPAGAVTKAGDIQIAETANGQLKAGEYDLLRDHAAQQRWTHPGQVRHPDQRAQHGAAAGRDRLRRPRRQPGPASSSESCAGRHHRPLRPGRSRSPSTSCSSRPHGTGKLVVDNIKSSPWPTRSNGPVLFNVYGYGWHADGRPVPGAGLQREDRREAGDRHQRDLRAGPHAEPGSVVDLDQGRRGQQVHHLALPGRLCVRREDRPSSTSPSRTRNGGWGPFVKLTSRLADASGTAYFQWRSTGQWVSVRAMLPR